MLMIVGNWEQLGKKIHVKTVIFFCNLSDPNP